MPRTPENKKVFKPNFQCGKLVVRGFFVEGFNGLEIIRDDDNLVDLCVTAIRQAQPGASKLRMS